MLPIKCLGLPLFSSRMFLTDCQPLIDKFRSRLSSCKAHMLSFAGTIDLIGSTLNAFYIFWASSFILPRACLDQLEKISRNLFWGSFEGNNRRLKTVAWAKICSPRENGGLCLASISELVSCALRTQARHVACRRKSIWVVWAYKKYIKGN